MRLVAILITLCLATVTGAQELPDLFDVTGVSDTDVLNVRKAPDAGSDIVGVLAYDATNIEVVAIDDSRRWGLVNASPETSGWVSLRFLTLVFPDASFDTDFDRPLWCVGTEPFWVLQNSPAGDVTWNSLDGEGAVTLSRVYASRASNRGRWNQVMVARSPDARLTVTLRQEQCDDGMSDSAFGFQAQILEERGGDARFVSGCCSLSAP